METEKQNIFKQFVLSLYSFKNYRNFAHTHGGKMFLYTLVMVCITYVVTFIVPTTEFVPYIFGLDTATVDEYVPYFEISNGEFYIEEEVYFEDESDFSMIVYITSDYIIPTDTAQEILRAYTQGFIISAEEMVIKQASGSVQQFSFASMPDMSRDYLYDLIPVIKVIMVIVYVVVFIGYVAVYMFGALICALIGQLINLIIKAPVTFGSIFKMTAYARTAPILIKMIFALFTPFSLHFVLFYALFVAYMVWALLAVKKSEDNGDDVYSPPDTYITDDTPQEN